MWFGKMLPVTLLVDLTRYHPRLLIGAKGTLVPNCKVGMWGSQDRFGAVRFVNGPIMDIALSNLEIHDETQI